MLTFESDYTTGTHEKILENLLKTNREPQSGYGVDSYSESARDKIRKFVHMDDAQIEFLTGGTQTNAVIIASMLKDYEGVVAASTGHISVHEAGAIEYSGNKVLQIPGKEGKIVPEVLQNYLEEFYQDGSMEHMVFPGMVYISHPTEYGTLYSLLELKQISFICREYKIPLFLDGARLGYGLQSLSTDVDITDIANLCDVFYIGGTKVGALCGEAVVFTKNNRPKHFITSVKKRGALLAKGRLLGVQFDTLFTDNLYMNISRHAIVMAEELKKFFLEKQVPFYLNSPTNQQFVILSNEKIEQLKDKVGFSIWEKADETHTVVRFATSWSTTMEDIELLKKIWD